MIDGVGRASSCAFPYPTNNSQFKYQQPVFVCLWVVFSRDYVLRLLNVRYLILDVYRSNFLLNKIKTLGYGLYGRPVVTDKIVFGIASQGD